jgi:hypothetical protein
MAISLFKNGRLGGEYEGRRFEVFIRAESPVRKNVQTFSYAPTVAVTLNSPVVVSTRPCTVEEAEALYAKAFAEPEAANSTIGSHAEAYAAMKYAGLKRKGALRKTRPGSRQLRRIPADKRAVQEKTAWEYPQP